MTATARHVFVAAGDVAQIVLDWSWRVRPPTAGPPPRHSDEDWFLAMRRVLLARIFAARAQNSHTLFISAEGLFAIPESRTLPEAYLSEERGDAEHVEDALR
jgi:hypothetical protein